MIVFEIHQPKELLMHPNMTQVTSSMSRMYTLQDRYENTHANTQVRQGIRNTGKLPAVPAPRHRCSGFMETISEHQARQIRTPDVQSGMYRDARPEMC